MNTYLIAICANGTNRITKVTANSYQNALNKLVDRLNSDYLDEPIDYPNSLVQLRSQLRSSNIYISSLTDLIEF